MVRLVHDPGLRQRLGQAARETIERHFTWKVGASRLLLLYWDVHGKRTGQDLPAIWQANKKDL